MIQVLLSALFLTNPAIQSREAYVTRDGLRIYLWEKFRPDREASFGRTGKIVLLVHGGGRSGRPAFDLQVRDYSLMDFLATNGYDVWAVDIHGYGRSDKTDKDWSDSRSAAADIATAVKHITAARGVARINLLGWSAGTQRAGVFAMDHPDQVAKLVLYAPFWKGTPEYREYQRKRIENGGRPLPQYTVNTEEALRADFVRGHAGGRALADEEVVRESVKEALRADPRSPSVFVEWNKLPILDPARITVPTMIIHGDEDYAAREEDLRPFYAQLATPVKRYVLLPGAGHLAMLERDHRRFQDEVRAFLDRP